MPRFRSVARRFPRPVMALIVVGLPLTLVGCGAAKSLINNNLPTVSNALQLDGQSVTGTVNGSRATISGNGTKEFSFANTTINQAGSLAEIKHSQKLTRSVTVTVPTGETLPTSFQLRNIALAMVLSDRQTNTGGDLEERTFAATLTVGSTVTFSRTGSDNTYTAINAPAFGDLVISGDRLTQFRNIVTGGGSPNQVGLRLSFDTDDFTLPNGSTITFTFTEGKATVKI
ncbi:MAG: hypothetical protein SFU56_07135 [Capsulimonadales bacterium]|nr:hypothetical protein [Capsulimonadales bacterium]